MRGTILRDNSRVSAVVFGVRYTIVLYTRVADKLSPTPLFCPVGSLIVHYGLDVSRLRNILYKLKDIWYVQMVHVTLPINRLGPRNDTLHTDCIKNLKCRISYYFMHIGWNCMLTAWYAGGRPGSIMMFLSSTGHMATITCLACHTRKYSNHNVVHKWSLL